MQPLCESPTSEEEATPFISSKPSSGALELINPIIFLSCLTSQFSISLSLRHHRRDYILLYFKRDYYEAMSNDLCVLAIYEEGGRENSSAHSFDHQLFCCLKSSITQSKLSVPSLVVSCEKFSHKKFRNLFSPSKAESFVPPFVPSPPLH